MWFFSETFDHPCLHTSSFSAALWIIVVSHFCWDRPWFSKVEVWAWANSGVIKTERACICCFSFYIWSFFKLFESKLTDRPVISQTLGFPPSIYPFTVCPFPVFFTYFLQYIQLLFSCDQQPFYEKNKIRNIDWYQII